MDGLRQPLRWKNVSGVAAAPFLAGYSGKKQNGSEADIADLSIFSGVGNHMFRALPRDKSRIVQR